jgi:hypothetical protein
MPRILSESKSLPLFDVYEGSELVQVIRAHDEEEAQKFIVPEWYPSGEWEIQQRERKINNV